MKKKILLFCIVPALILTGAVFSQNVSCSETKFMLDTYVTLTARGFNAKKAVSECFDEIKNFEQKSSVYISDSEISRLNETGENTLSDELLRLVSNAKIYTSETDGAFDITVKPLADLWNIKNFTRVPTEAEIAETMPKIGADNIEISENSVRLKNGAQIDLGGAAKGYLADKCAQIMQKHRVKSAICDLGGNIYALGGKNIKIGLQNPNGARGEYFGYIEGKNISVVTSGGYERFAELDGKKYIHIISPLNGKCAESDVASASIIGKSSEKCDAFATAVCVLGVEKGLEIVRAESGIECVIADKNGRVYTSGNVNFKITDENFTRGN